MAGLGWLGAWGGNHNDGDDRRGRCDGSGGEQADMTTPAGNRITLAPVPVLSCRIFYADGSTAIASIEMSRPRGSATLAGAERAGGGSGMKRA